MRRSRNGKKCWRAGRTTFANRNLGTVLMMTGRRDESEAHLRKATDSKDGGGKDDPRSAQAHARLGAHLAETGRAGEAAAEARKAVDLKPERGGDERDPGRSIDERGQAGCGSGGITPGAGPHIMRWGKAGTGRAMCRRPCGNGGARWRSIRKMRTSATAWAPLFWIQGRRAKALAEWRAAVELRPNGVTTLERAAWLLATSQDGSLHNGGEEMALLSARAMQYSIRKDTLVLGTMAAA